ncbi:MAG TPA: serine/threonine protein kinase, partial [Polyangiaceae bacterium]|nr:serine/threonine protein kinase [Polyangiaceae bacterium]
MVASELKPGERCGRYEIERVLGRGGMGIVYLARTPDGEPRAIKTLLFGGKLKEQLVERFKREILLLASIEHVHVVRFYEAGKLERKGGTTMWLSLEYLPGESLRQIIDRHPQGVGVEDAARWARHIADGVGAAHRIHVIHRDLKPENAALSGDIVKVFDLGIAKWRGALNATAANLRMGTLAYMAPEQLDPSLGEVDERTDVYALGLILHELATGEHPLIPLGEPVSPLEAQGRILGMDPPSIVARRPGFPADLEAIAARCMRKEPAERFPSMREVSDALEDVLLRLRTERHAAAFADLGVGLGADQAPAAILRRAKSSSGSDETPPPVVQASTPGGGYRAGMPSTVKMDVGESSIQAWAERAREQRMARGETISPALAAVADPPAPPTTAATTMAAPTGRARVARPGLIAAVLVAAAALGVGVVAVKRVMTPPVEPTSAGYVDSADTAADPSVDTASPEDPTGSLEPQASGHGGGAGEPVEP